jgi:hypothetical protein
MTDPIVAEIRAIRERIAEESGCDIHAIAEAARKRQQTSGVRTVSRPKRVPDASLAKPVSVDSESVQSGTDGSAPAVS